MHRALATIFGTLGLIACSSHETVGASSSALVGDVSVEKVGSGTIVSLSSDGILCSTGCLSTAYNFGSEATVTLRGEAAVGWVFDHWEGDCTGTGEICEVAPNPSSFARAVFVPGTNTLCPSQATKKDFFTTSPIATSSIAAARTFGTDPPDHTFPNWHMFLDANAVVPVVSPGRVRVTSVMRNGADYYFRLSPCRGVEMLVALVQNLPSALVHKLGPSDATYLNAEFWSHPSVSLLAGDVLGSVAAGRRQIALELYDDRQPVAAWTNPANYRAVHRYIQCPIDYFTTSVRTFLMGKFSDGQCHRPDQDLAPYLRGNWFADAAAPGSNQSQHIAFVNDMVAGVWSPVVSVGRLFDGTGAGTLAGRYPITAGAPFDLALPEAGLYCYALAAQSLLVSFDDAYHLRAKVVPTPCAMVGPGTIDTVSPSIPPVAFHR
jgi:hypothetical protein